MKVLADTNIWCDFFNRGDTGFEELLKQQSIVMHSVILGELSSGNLPKREQTLHDLKQISSILEASPQETLALVEAQKLYGQGLQWNDLLLLASVLIAGDVKLWTRDAKLARVAHKLKCRI